MSLQWKSDYNVFIYFASVLCIALHIKFRAGQKYTKCYQLAALNKNAGSFVILSDFLSLHLFEMFISASELSNFSVEVETDRLLLTNFPVTFILNQRLYYVLLNNIFLYRWGKHLLFIKLFTVHNNYFSLINRFNVKEFIYH